MHARSVGAEVIAEFQDVESGRKDDRTGLAAALALCRSKRAILLIAKLDRLARSVAFISNLMESGVDFLAADMPTVNRLTIHVLAAVAEHEREMISQRTKAALAAAKVRGTRLGNPRLPATGTLAAAPQPSTPGGRARVASARAHAVAAYGLAIDVARSGGALSLGDYALALQAARLPAPVAATAGHDRPWPACCATASWLTVNRCGWWRDGQGAARGTHIAIQGNFLWRRRRLSRNP
jgi:hypothetical protein